MRPELDGGRVTVLRDGAYREVVLSRPARHNAIDVAMRDELIAVLRAIAIDPDVPSVGLVGSGPSFCSGGDLDQFGTTDALRAHLTRTARSLPLLVAELGPRLVVGVHGSCIGAGMELAAFGRQVLASPDATFRLPELRMGLIPGMGGTYSIAHRVGRARTLELLLSGETMTARDAQKAGLVDRIVEREALITAVRACAGAIAS